MERPNIFEYVDFRKFLADYQAFKYETDKEFSCNKICIKLGLPNTKSYFKDVIKGKLVTSTFVERFINSLDLSRDEARYFRVLVPFNQSVSNDERELLFDQLISLNRTPKKFINKKHYTFYKEWHHSVIRALLDVYDVKDDYKFLAKNVWPPITTKQARESITLMKDIGLIEKTADRFWKSTDKSITAGSYVQDELIRQYQLRCLEQAGAALLSDDPRPRNISTNTISISEKGYRHLEKYLQKFKSEVRTLVHKDSDPADRVYHLNINLFPQSR